MSILISKSLVYATRYPAAQRFAGWVKANLFWLNPIAYSVVFVVSYGLSLYSFQGVSPLEDSFLVFKRTVVFIVFLKLAGFWYYGLFEGLWVHVSFVDALNITRATVLSTLISALPGLFHEAAWVPQQVLLLDALFCICFTYGIRLIGRRLYEGYLSQSAAVQHQKIALIGPLRRLQILGEEMAVDPFAYYKPEFLVDIGQKRKGLRQRFSDIPILSITDILSQRERLKNVSYLVVCWPNATQDELDELVESLKPLGIPFTSLPYLDEIIPPEYESPGSDTLDQEDGPGSGEEPQAKRAKRLFLSPPHMSGLEQEYVRRAFRSNYIAPLGPMVDAFEHEFAEMTGIAHAVALSSGTAAIHLTMRNLGVGPGDIVVASTLTFIGSVTPVVFQGALPYFVDSDPDTWTMNVDLVEEALRQCAEWGRLPKAVLPTDLYGQCSDYGRLSAVCQRFGVPLIVDAAEAMGASYNGKHAGNGVTAAVFSFNGNKIITTSGGGMLASDDREFVDQARFLSQQARDPFPHYEHSQVGYNYRMSNIVAAIGQGQLRVLEERVQRKREIFALYQAALGETPGISFMPEASYGRCNRWLTVILIDPEIFGADRETVRLALEKENIESRPTWKPMHLQPVFRIIRSIHDSSNQAGISDGRRIPAYVRGGWVAEDIFVKGLCLPSGTAMTKADVERAASVVRSCFNSANVVIPSRAVAQT